MCIGRKLWLIKNFVSRLNRKKKERSSTFHMTLPLTILQTAETTKESYTSLLCCKMVFNFKIFNCMNFTRLFQNFAL